MVARTIIDLEDDPNLTELVHEITGSDTLLILRENGKEIAEIRPIAEGEPRPSALDPINPRLLEVIRRRRENKPTPENIENAKSAAGGWADVDTDRLIREIYEDRDRNLGRTSW